MTLQKVLQAFCVRYNWENITITVWRLGRHCGLEYICMCCSYIKYIFPNIILAHVVSQVAPFTPTTLLENINIIYTRTPH